MNIVLLCFILLVVPVLLLSPILWLYWMESPVRWKENRFLAACRIISALIVLCILGAGGSVGVYQLIDKEYTGLYMLSVITGCVLAAVASLPVVYDNILHAIMAEHINSSLRRVASRRCMYIAGLVGYVLLLMPLMPYIELAWYLLYIEL